MYLIIPDIKRTFFRTLLALAARDPLRLHVNKLELRMNHMEIYLYNNVDNVDYI